MKNGRVSRLRSLGALGVVAALALAACGDDEDNSDASAAEETDAPASDATNQTDEAPASDVSTGEGDGTEATAAEGDKPFDGVTITFGKAPHGEDEKGLWDAWLADFKAQTGINVELTQVPWDQLEALYTANFASDEPYDVTYQTSTHLSLFGERGAFGDLTSRIDGADFAEDKAQFPQGLLDAGVFNGTQYGIPFVVGTIVMYANLDMLESAGVAIPTSYDELAAAATAVMADQQAQGNDDVWGFYTPRTVADFGWYFTLVDAKNRGGDILDGDGNPTFDSQPVIDSAAFAAELICTDKVQPEIGLYDREAAVELFKSGKLVFLLDEPSRVKVFQEEALPFAWDIAMPVGFEGTQKQFSTLGYWAVAAKSKNEGAAWEFVKYLSSAEFASDYNGRYGFVPARLDADASGGDPLLAKNQTWISTWDGLLTDPNIASLTDAYGQALEASASCSSTPEEAFADAQEKALEIVAG